MKAKTVSGRKQVGSRQKAGTAGKAAREAAIYRKALCELYDRTTSETTGGPAAGQLNEIALTALHRGDLIAGRPV